MNISFHLLHCAAWHKRSTMCPSFRYNTHFLAEDFQSTVVVLLTQRPANTWKEKAKADHIVKALPPFSLFLCTTSHSGWRGNENWNLALSRSYCKGSASFLSLSMYHEPQWLKGGRKSKFGTKKHTNSLTPCWSVLDFWKINLEKSSFTNWIFSLFQTGFFTACVACKNQFPNWFLKAKNPVHGTWVFQLDFFLNSSTDQQGVTMDDG